MALDAEGFVTIKGRAKRFAKIAGEMVSLAALEAVAADLWPDAGTAMTTLPDPRKGERIVLVTERKDATRQAFAAHARQEGVADVAMPSEVVVVDALPLLGSGKLDHPGRGAHGPRAGGGEAARDGGRVRRRAPDDAVTGWQTGRGEPRWPMNT